jgi:hypothetical protein
LDEFWARWDIQVVTAVIMTKTPEQFLVGVRMSVIKLKKKGGKLALFSILKSF